MIEDVLKEAEKHKNQESGVKDYAYRYFKNEITQLVIKNNLDYEKSIKKLCDALNY